MTCILIPQGSDYYYTRVSGNGFINGFFTDKPSVSECLCVLASFSHYTSIIAYLFCKIDAPTPVCILKRRKIEQLGLHQLKRSFNALSRNCSGFPNNYRFGGRSAHCQFSEELIHWKRASLGLLLGMLHKQKQPYLPPLCWICKWPGKAPISSVLQQQRYHWVSYTLLEIPTRFWSLGRRFMQHEPTHTHHWLSVYFADCFSQRSA